MREVAGGVVFSQRSLVGLTPSSALFICAKQLLIDANGAPLEPRPITTSLPWPSAASFLADQQEKRSDTYQQRNQNTDNERGNPMSSLDRLRSSAFLRCSDAQPEEKIAHS
jgi:hypothetical protein